MLSRNYKNTKKKRNREKCRKVLMCHQRNVLHCCEPILPKYQTNFIGHSLQKIAENIPFCWWFFFSNFYQLFSAKHGRQLFEKIVKIYFCIFCLLLLLQQLIFLAWNHDSRGRISSVRIVTKNHFIVPMFKHKYHLLFHFLVCSLSK